jgi:hypothetical protein
VKSARLLACAVVVVLPTCPCAAQAPDQVRRDAQIHVGPLYLTPSFAVKELGVDTNVFNNDENRRDFTVTLAPRGQAWVPFGRRALVTVAGTADLVWYQRYDTERSLNPEVRVRTDLFLGRLTPWTEASYLRTRQRPNFEIDVRSLRQERTVRAGIDARLFSKTFVSASVAHRPLTFGAGATFNDVNLRETLNRETTTRSMEVRYAATPLTTVVFRAEAAADRFDLSPLRDADSVRLLPGVEFAPRALVSGTAHVGFRRFTPRQASLEPFAGLVAMTSLSYVLRGATKVTVTADRDLTYSYERTQPYFIVNAFGITVRRQLVGSVDAVAGFHRERYGYRDLILDGGTPADRDRIDITRTWSANVGYRVGRGMRAAVGAMYRARESSSDRFRDYEGLRIITTLDYGF